jgi:Na+/serine symporter
MFTDAQLAYLLVPVILCWLVVAVLMRRRQAKEPDPIKRAWINFKVTTIGSGIVLVILWLALPSTASLSTFGHSKGLSDVTDPQVLMIYMRDCIQAVVRTTEVVGWLLFLLVLWFGSALYDFLRILTQRTASNPADSPSRPSNAIAGMDRQPSTG